MKKEDLLSLNKEEIKSFIRSRLAFDPRIGEQLRCVEFEEFQKDHRRFDMSGYESKTGECTLHNLSILNEFADLGIYDYTTYLFLNFYKGSGTLYYQYLDEDENLQMQVPGETTTEIIYKIFQVTIFSDKYIRRRS